MPSAEQVQATLDEYVTRFNAGDGAAWAALFHPDARQEDPVGAPENVGRAAIQAFYDNVRQLGPATVKVEQGPIIIGAEAILCISVVTDLGDQQVRVPFIVDHFTIDDDGLITSLRAFFDQSTIALEPTPDA